MGTEPWYVLLDQLISREGLSRPQVARRSGIKTKTITSWVRGDVKKPRRWIPLAYVLHALQATPFEANQILRRAGFAEAEVLQSRASKPERDILQRWVEPQTLFMAPELPVAQVFGRHEILTHAEQLLKSKNRCAIWGMGGVGKTTVAISLANRLQRQYPDGIYWGDLRLSSAEAILDTWGQVSGVDVTVLPDLHSKAARLRGLFSQKRALIILDDVINSQEALLLIPSQLSNCAVVITTRSEEVARNMVRNQKDLVVSLVPIARDQSLALLEAALRDDRVTASRDAAAQLADLMGDLPLALQIGASLCQDWGLTLEQLVEMLSDLRTRLDHLRQEEQPVVRLAFEQSWALLTNTLKQAFAILSLFGGRSFATDAFAYLAEVDEVQATRLLTKLCRLSLLTTQKNGRFKQHPLLAAYATEKFSGEPAMRIRFARYYYALLAEHSWAALAQDDRDHSLAAVQTVAELQLWDEVLAFYHRLHPTMKAAGLYTALRQVCAWALDAAEQTGKGMQAAEITMWWGLACLEQSAYAEARIRLDDALSRYQRFGDDARAADCYYHLSRLALEQDEFDQAEVAIRHAWAHYQRAESLRGLGRAIYRLANIQYHRGNYNEAIQLAQEALRTQTKIDDLRGQLNSRMLLITAHVQQGEIDLAEAHCQAAEPIAHELDDLNELSAFYYTYADFCRFKGDFKVATTYARKALAIFRDMYDTFSEANALNTLAGIEIFWNDKDPDRQIYAPGHQYCHEGLAICEAIDYSLGKAFLLLMQGRLFAQQQLQDRACRAWAQSHELALVLDHNWLKNRLAELMSSNDCPPIHQTAESLDLP